MKKGFYISLISIAGLCLAACGNAVSVETKDQTPPTAQIETVATEPVPDPVKPDLFEIDEKNFPDEVFRAYISEYMDYDSDGSLNDKELKDAKAIQMNGDEANQCKSLKGIENFPNMEEIFVYNNGIQEIDLSSNKKVRTLVIASNNLSELDVSCCPELQVGYDYFRQS